MVVGYRKCLLIYCAVFLGKTAFCEPHSGIEFIWLLVKHDFNYFRTLRQVYVNAQSFVDSRQYQCVICSTQMYYILDNWRKNKLNKKE